MIRNDELRIPFVTMQELLKGKLTGRGFAENDASLSARLFTESSCDGVYSHGLNRFPAYIRNVDRGYIKADEKPKRMLHHGVLEQWNGQLGPGNLNAWFCMERAMEIARENGVGCVALRQTNHWLRGGTYGWQAADNGCIAMLWSNTTGNMVPWGGIDPTIGNNPFILAVPRASGHVVLDFAQTLYSYGKMSQYLKHGELLPYMCGYDSDGNLTNDPESIVNSMRALPAGLWKSSGLAIMLDLIAVILSGGKSTMEINRQDYETGLSQVFIAIAPHSGIYGETRETLVDRIITNLQETTPAGNQEKVRYPGERTLKIREENRKKGIPVDPEIWKQVQEL